MNSVPKDNFNIPVLIVSINQNAVSETFIHGHIKELGQGIHYLSGTNGHYITASGKKINPLNRFQRILARLKIIKTTHRHNGLEKYIKKNKIKAIVAEYGIAGVAIMPWCKQLNIPLFVFFYGYDISVKEILETYKIGYKKLTENAERLFIVSKHMLATLKELGAHEEKIIYNPCYLSDQYFSNKPEYGRNHFLYVGRMVEKKGPQLVLLAFSGVAARFTEARLTMIGDGPLLGACQWLARSLGIADKVHFKGALPHAETLQAFSQAFCVVQHSVQAHNGDSEGTPVALLEAGAAALPVVSTRHAGIPDAIIHGETGLLTEEGDVAGMTAHMCSLFADRALAERMGAAARAHIYTHYRREKHMEILKQAIYRAVNPGIAS